jgi:hypothetical protein
MFCKKRGKDCYIISPAIQVKLLRALQQKQMIIDSLMANNGNMAKSAAQSSVTERAGLRIKKYNIQNYKYLSNDNS